MSEHMVVPGSSDSTVSPGRPEDWQMRGDPSRSSESEPLRLMTSRRR